MSNKANTEFEFKPFCGLHYTSDQDIQAYGDNLNSFTDKSFILNTYINYFTNLCCSMFKVRNLPKDIDEQFVIRTLITKGSIAFFKTSLQVQVRNEHTGQLEDREVVYPLLAQPFITNGTFNIYGKPTSIRLQTSANCDMQFNNHKLDIDDFEIVKLNPMAVSLYPTIYYFCNKIVEVQRSIDVNVHNNQTPLVIECRQEQQKTIIEFLRKWGKQVKSIILNKSAGARSEDLFKAQDISAQWKADKMTDVMQYYKAEFFTMLGINHTPYEKRANMVRDEVRSNAHILRLTVESMLTSLNECCKLLNEKFNTEIYFEYTLDSIYDTDSISTAQTKRIAGILTEEEANNEELQEAYMKAMIADGEIVDDYMFGKGKQGYTAGNTSPKSNVDRRK